MGRMSEFSLVRAVICLVYTSRKELIDILIAEVKPALGCTEPVAVALACAKAKELLGEEIVENRILVSPSIYKNGMCVGIPGTERLGLKIAVAMGFVGEMCIRDRCVSLFYAITSLSSSSYEFITEDSYNFKTLQLILKYSTYVITAILILLIAYVNKYMIRRRQREFATYILLGAEQKSIAFMFFIERCV